jgi:hypothetical protein
MPWIFLQSQIIGRYSDKAFEDFKWLLKRPLKALCFFCYQTVTKLLSPMLAGREKSGMPMDPQRSLTKPKNMRKTVQTKNEVTILGKAAKGLVIIGAISKGINGD